jgi:uncharacterized protein YukE
LVVDPEALFAVGSAVIGAGDGLAANLTVLTAGVAAHTGLDAAGEVFGLAYQDSAESLLKAAAAAINACRQSGAVIEQGASNYSKAEAASKLGGGADVLQAPAEPAKITAPGPPGTWGKGQPPPLLWAVVESFVDDVWPDGDVAGLHAAAARWRGFAGSSGGMRSAVNAAKSLLDAHQIPEGGKIDEALSQIGTGMGQIGEASGKLATALDGFANEVDHAQNSIRDLLNRLGSLTDVGHDLMLLVKGDALDEIKKIANDINEVLHNLGREARAAEQGVKQGLGIVDGLVVKLEKYVRGELKQFLGDAVGNQVATAFDVFVNANEGVLKGAVGMALSIGDLDPRWFLVDPHGAAATWAGLGKGLWKGSLFNAVINPQEAGEANWQQLKSLLHLDDWSTARPGLGFGENVFDGAMLFIPGGGEVGGAADGAGAAARGAEAAADAGRAGVGATRGLEGLAGARGALADIAGTGCSLTKDLQGVTGNLPKIEPPLSGQPVALPPKASEAPVGPAARPPDTAPGTPESQAPASAPTPSEPPGVAGAPHDPGSTPGEAAPAQAPAGAGGPHEPVPAGGPREPVPAPAGGPSLSSVPVAAGERVPAAVPQLAEHSPAQVPVSPSGSPVESAPVAGQSMQQPLAAASTAPHLTPPPGHAPELPASGGGWHGSADGGPSGAGLVGKSPHGGGPHGPDVGHPSKLPGHDGAPHGPGDGPADHGHYPSPTEALTSDDLSVLAHYTGSGYADLNDALRSNVLDASQHARVEALNNALGKLPPYEGPVIRGTNLPPETLAQYRPGEIITEDAFLSTTTDPAVARSPGFAGNVEFRIMSSTGRDVTSVSMFPDEQEILFPSGTSFYVVSKTIDPVTGRTVIRMAER